MRLVPAIVAEGWIGNLLRWLVLPSIMILAFTYVHSYVSNMDPQGKTRKCLVSEQLKS